MSDGALGEHPIGGMEADTGGGGGGGGGGPDYVLTLSAAAAVDISPGVLNLFATGVVYTFAIDAAATVAITGGTVTLFTDAPLNHFNLTLDAAAAVDITPATDGLTLYWSVPHINLGLDVSSQLVIDTPANSISFLAPTPPIEIELIEHMLITETATPQVAFQLIEGLVLTQTQDVTSVWKLAEDLLLADVDVPTTKYGMSLHEALEIADVLHRADNLTLSETLNLTAAMTVVQAVKLMETLLIAPVMRGAGIYGETLMEALKLSQPLQEFFDAGDLSETLHVHDTITAQLRAGVILTEELNLSITQVPTLILSGVLSEELELADADVLSAIYNGTLSETLELSAAYISPGGTTATWVMNTRNSAVTEYTNFTFNSFAQMGNRFLGANSTGLYRLDGDTDAGTDIVWKIKSGHAKFNGQRLGGFKAVYLGVRGEGDYVLRMDTLDGREFGYRIRAMDGAVTKIPVGKGLRATYWSFELTGIGARSELDNVEFVPMRANRRV